MTKSLSPKQEAFVLAYIGEARFNATKAAIAAGYGKGSPSSQGYALMQNPVVSARIREELSNRSLTADGVLSELADVANADWREFLVIKTDPRTGQDVEVKIDLADKIKALELIGKAHGIFTERVDVSGTLTAQVNLVGISEDDV